MFEKFYTWSNDHIQQVFQISERSDQYSRRYDILNSYPFWNMLYRFYEENNGFFFQLDDTLRCLIS